MVWNRIADNDLILAFLKDRKEPICHALDKINGSEYNRLRYLSAIIKNNIVKFKPKVQVDENICRKKVEEHNFETIYTLKKRRGLDEIVF